MELCAIVAEPGMGYEFLSGHTFKASAGQGYKAPTQQELYLSAGSGTISDLSTRMEFQDIQEVSNYDLDAEESLDYEVSYEYSGDRMRLD